MKEPETRQTSSRSLYCFKRWIKINKKFFEINFVTLDSFSFYLDRERLFVIWLKMIFPLLLCVFRANDGVENEHYIDWHSFSIKNRMMNTFSFFYDGKMMICLWKSKFVIRIVKIKCSLEEEMEMKCNGNEVITLRRLIQRKFKLLIN